MSIGTYDVLVLLHILMFAYWLGADVAVLYAAKYGADPGLSLETRQTIGNIMAFVDMFPRLSVPLIGASGVTMAFLSGALRLHEAWIWLAWLAALVWISSNLFIYMNRKDPTRVRSMLTFDALWRTALLLVIAGVAVASFFGVGIASSRSIAAKLLIYSMAIALSLVLRLLFRPYRPALNRIAAGGDSATESAVMNKALTRARPAVFAIWFLTVVEAAIGLWKPY